MQRNSIWFRFIVYKKNKSNAPALGRLVKIQSLPNAIILWIALYLYLHFVDFWRCIAALHEFTPLHSSPARNSFKTYLKDDTIVETVAHFIGITFSLKWEL